MGQRAEAAERIRTWRNIHQQPLAHPSHAIWAVQLKSPTGTPAPLVGTLLLKSIPASGGALPLEPSGDTEIGWHFHPDHWGHGYATEAAGTALAYALAGGLDTVVAVTAPANTASQKVCLRIGMTHRGQTDRYCNSTCELFETTTLH